MAIRPSRLVGILESSWQTSMRCFCRALLPTLGFTIPRLLPLTKGQQMIGHQIVQGGLNLFAGGFMLIEALMLLLAFAIAFLLFVALPWWLAAHILLRHHLKQGLL